MMERYRTHPTFEFPANGKPRPQPKLRTRGLVTIDFDANGHFDLLDVERCQRRHQSGYQMSHADLVKLEIALSGTSRST